MSDLGDRLRQIAAQADEQPLFGVAMILVGDKECLLAIPPTDIAKSDVERTMMQFGLALYQATNMTPAGGDEG